MSVNVEAIERNGKQYVPLKEIVEQMGGSVRWDNEAKSASVNVEQATAMLDANANTITVNGQQRPLSAGPVFGKRQNIRDPRHVGGNGHNGRLSFRRIKWL